MIIYIKQLKFKEKVPKQCPELYWELRKLGARPFHAHWKSKAILNFKEGQELSCGEIYQDMRKAGLNPIQSLKIEIVYWANYDKTHPVTVTEAGMILSMENNDRKINYINCLVLPYKLKLKLK